MSEKLMMTASDVADVLGVSVGHAYKIIESMVFCFKNGSEVEV